MSTDFIKVQLQSFDGNRLVMHGADGITRECFVGESLIGKPGKAVVGGLTAKGGAMIRDAYYCGAKDYEWLVGEFVSLPLSAKLPRIVVPGFEYLPPNAPTQAATPEQDTIKIRVNAISDKEAHLRVSTCLDEVHVFHDSTWNGYLTFIRGRKVRFIEPLCKGGRVYECEHGMEIDLPQPDWYLRPDGVVAPFQPSKSTTEPHPLGATHAMRGFSSRSEALADAGARGFQSDVGYRQLQNGLWEWYCPKSAVDAATQTTEPEKPLPTYRQWLIDILHEFGYCEDKKAYAWEEFGGLQGLSAWALKHGVLFEVRRGEDEDRIVYTRA